MTLLVTSDFKIDGPDFAYAGFGKFSIPKGAQLLDVTGPDRFGYMKFVYNNSPVRGQISVVMEHTVEEAASDGEFLASFTAKG